MSRSFVEQQRIHWDNVAEGWTALSDWTERNFAPLTAWLADAVALTPGVHALDVACGVGYPALPTAQRVMPGGGGVAVDLSHNMLTAAARLAAARGLTNVEFRQMDAEQLTFDEGTFDAVTNTYGLMFCADPHRRPTRRDRFGSHDRVRWPTSSPAVDCHSSGSNRSR